MRHLKVCSWICTLTGLLFSLNSHAAADINFHGTLIELTCKVSDEDSIDVDFGDQVVTDLIDGQHYMQTVPLKIVCNNNYRGDLNFTVVGTAITFDKAAVKTNVDDVGIKLLRASDSSPVELNKSYVHKHNDVVDLKVVPVKATDSAPKGGEFNATVQLLIEPQ